MTSRLSDLEYIQEQLLDIEGVGLKYDEKLDNILFNATNIENKFIKYEKHYGVYYRIVEINNTHVYFSYWSDPILTYIDYKTIKILKNNDFKWIIYVIDKSTGYIFNLFESCTLGCKHDLHEIDKVKIFNSYEEAFNYLTFLEERFPEDNYIIKIERLS